MGLALSLMRRGLSPQQILSLAVQGVYKNIEALNVKDFADFHSSILSLYKTANSALPGRHFEAPSRGEVEKAFNEWKSAQNEEKKREIFKELLKNIKLGELDNLTLIVGLAAPPFSMAAKRAGENAYPFKMIKSVPHPFKMIRSVPDALLVPSCTLLAAIFVKMIRKVSKGITEEEINADTLCCGCAMDHAFISHHC